MYELIQVGENTYYMDCPSKVGIYRFENDEVLIIDSGSSKDAARKLNKGIEEKGWKINTIINTHLHTDHISGNSFLQNKTGCKILAPKEEKAFIENPHFFPIFFNLGTPLKEFQNSMFMAKPSKVEVLTKKSLPDGFEFVTIEGHSLDMAAIKTPDNIWFIGDGVFGEETINKYHISYIYDVEKFLNSLTILENLEGNMFIPSHTEPLESLGTICQLNRNNSAEVLNIIEDICKEPNTLEEIVAKIFEHYKIVHTVEQHFLLTATINSYITALHHRGSIHMEAKNNRLYWVKVDNSGLAM